MANKILICDDDQIITDSLSEYLSAMDYEILAVNDGNGALNNFVSFNPDLVLLDIMMPNPNGLDVIKIIREKKYCYYYMDTKDKHNKKEKIIKNPKDGLGSPCLRCARSHDQKNM